MFSVFRVRMLASMISPDPRADTPPLNWSDLGVSELPTGTVTLLLADVEDSTRLWETRPEEMTTAFARLDTALSNVSDAHGGVRPVEQGEGDSFVIAFGRAGDAVACALELQRAPLAPISLRIGLHTGDVQLRDEANYIGPTINRAGRLRDLAHGGQTVLSGTTDALVCEALPAGAWLTDLGSHELRGVPRPERVVQLCHPDICNEFPPLRTSRSVAVHNLPAQLTSFVGREAQIRELRTLLAGNRFVTLTGAGGAGKTRLAVEIAAQVAADFEDGVWYVDLAPTTHPDVVPVAVARALGLPDQPGQSAVDSLVGFLRNRRVLVVLDNCEHLLDACARLVSAVLGSCPEVTLLATSREPIRASGEATWPVPSLSLEDEATQLFTDRARQVRPDFRVGDDNAATVAEICKRLDGMPLAIELAAARVRALSLTEILDSLHNRFRLLTGGARTAVRRQQTLRASVDWSHALLSEGERVLFRRLAVFLGGFDLDAARAVAGGVEVERYQVLDQLSLLVEKSLVVAENVSGRTRYRLLETVRQYAMEKLGESGEAGSVRSRHRDHYTSMAAVLDAPSGGDHPQRIDQAEVEMDNMRSAFGWSLETGDVEHALELASWLQPLWLTRGRIMEGLAWFDAALGDEDPDVAAMPAERVRALADKSTLGGWIGAPDAFELAERALTRARELDDPALVVRALTARCCDAIWGAEEGGPDFAEAARLARELGDLWRLSQILGRHANVSVVSGDPVAMGAAGEEGLQIAEAIGDRFNARYCRWAVGCAQIFRGDLAGAIAQFDQVIAEATAAHDGLLRAIGFNTQVPAYVYHGDAGLARAAADMALQDSTQLGGFHHGFAHSLIAGSCLAAGDAAAAWDASEAALQRVSAQPLVSVLVFIWSAQAALACGDVATARSRADEAVSVGKGGYLSMAMTVRARVKIAQGQAEEAERDSYEALGIAESNGARLCVPDIFDCLASLACSAADDREAARLFGATESIRRQMDIARLKVYDAGYEAAVANLCQALGDDNFEAAWAEGAALTVDEAIAYVQRGRGQRKRPSSGWASLTPTELDVARLVGEGLGNKEIGAKLLISPRTVETHLTHVYTKLGLTSRVQLAQQAVSHAAVDRTR
jgi:predicted ATPase/class 3 adenylate cyclase/DNA-binding CsgD family transcriptional regulator